MKQAEKLTQLTVVALFVVVIVGGFFVYQLNAKQRYLETLIPAVCTENVCDTKYKVEKQVETIVHKTSPWGALQPQIKDCVVQIFSQVTEFNWLQPYQTPMQKMGSGTGFFIDDAGYLITNAHVVNQAQGLTIQIPSLGKEQFEVYVVGISFDRDIALLRLKDSDLERVTMLLGKISYLPIGDSDKLYRADEVMYQGFPLGQQGLKSTVGVVSGRENMSGRQYIQIDAATNPGCSGGPALNLDGEVVGVLNSGIPGAQNVGYIIPTKELKVVLDDLYHSQDPLIRRPFLGIAYNSSGNDLNHFLGNKIDGGVYVVAVYKDSVLDNVGVKAGDIIYEINGHKIDYYGEISVPWAEDRTSLTEYVSYLSIGQSIDLVVYRNGKKIEFNFKFVQPKLPAIRFMYPDFEKIDYEVIGGFVIMQLTLNHVVIMQQAIDDLVSFKDPKNQNESKLLITHILPASLAQRSRVFEPGNIIKSVNEEPVATLADLRRALKKSVASGSLTIRSKQDVFAVFPFAKILKQEPQLSMIYRYQISPTVQSLIQDMAQADSASHKNIDLVTSDVKKEDLANQDLKTQAGSKQPAKKSINEQPEEQTEVLVA